MSRRSRTRSGDRLARVACAVLLDHGGAVGNGDHLRLDGDVAAGDAGLVEQPRMLEEDVHEFPEHVVGGLVHLLPEVWIGRGNGEREVGRPGVEGDRQQLAGSRLLEEPSGVLLDPDGDVAWPHQREDIVRRRERRQRTLADDHGVHEFDRDVRSVRLRRAGAVREQGPAPCECPCHRVAGERDPRLLVREEVAQDAFAFLERPSHSMLLPFSSASSCSYASPSCSRKSSVARASSSSIFESAKPTWIKTQSPVSTSPASRPTLTLRRTPETSALAMWCSGSTNSTI